jgi:hypothetical protein
MKLLDVNVLVQAHREDSDDHVEVLGWLQDQLSRPPGVAVTELVLSGFLRVVTHPRIFKEVTPLAQALAFVDDFRQRTQVRILHPGKRHWEIFVQLCVKGDARGNLIPDAYHAAIAIEHGLEWITFDRGFARFPGLRWSLPHFP